MRALIRGGGLTLCVLALGGLFARAGWVGAYPQYSQNRDATACRACHGDFRDNNYVSPVDGQNWGDLHDIHRDVMLNGDCETCHGSNDFPVVLKSSRGGSGLSSIGCMGCHGRTADHSTSNPDYPQSGLGAGLRQHHFKAGETVCAACHLDADPANFTPVVESELPEYYANPGSGHSAIPTSSCNAGGVENFAGSAIGLDNDGDGLYDGDDPDCTTPIEATTWGAIKSLYQF